MKFRSLALALQDRLAPTITQLDVRSVQREAGSLAMLSAKSINIRSNYQLSTRPQIASNRRGRLPSLNSGKSVEK